MCIFRKLGDTFFADSALFFADIAFDKAKKQTRFAM